MIINGKYIVIYFYQNNKGWKLIVWKMSNKKIMKLKK